MTKKIEYHVTTKCLSCKAVVPVGSPLNTCCPDCGLRPDHRGERQVIRTSGKYSVYRPPCWLRVLTLGIARTKMTLLEEL